MAPHFATLSLGNRSLTLPPATLRKVDPKKPVRNRKIKKTAEKGALLRPSHELYDQGSVPISGANATGHDNAKNMPNDTR